VSTSVAHDAATLCSARFGDAAAAGGIALQRRFAFLRAINVGGRTVRMRQLREVFEQLGYTAVETFIASGNVVFDAGRRRADRVEAEIEEKLHTALGFQTDTFVRDTAELLRVLAAAGPRDGGTADIAYVGFLKRAPDAAACRRLAALNSATDDFRASDREVYWVRRGGAESPYNGAAIEKALGMPTTMRNRNTIERMAARFCRSA
jgi:uncharacterized protein (DUF1697 family)